MESNCIFFHLEEVRSPVSDMHKCSTKLFTQKPTLLTSAYSTSTSFPIGKNDCITNIKFIGNETNNIEDNFSTNEL